jgi:hypothetical protein
MTPERIKLFLRCFYEEYVRTVYQGFEAETETEELARQLNDYDVHSYFLNHLDIYVQHCDFMKEYSFIYNPAIFDISKEKQPETFNELELFLIENIQLFLHTILEAAINTYIVKTSTIKGLKIFVKPIDNKSIKIVDLVDKAEKRMKELNVLPPAMG